MREWTANLCLSATCITTAAATGDDVDHRTFLLIALGLQGRSNSSRVGCALVSVCPSLTSLAFRIAGLLQLLSCPCYSSVQHSVLGKPGDFCSVRKGVGPTPSVASLKAHQLKQRDTESDFVSQKDMAVAVFFSTSSHLHPNLLLMQDITTCTHFAWISAHFAWTSGSQDVYHLPWCAVTRLVTFACAQHLQARFCSQVGKCKPLLFYNELQVAFSVFTNFI